MISPNSLYRYLSALFFFSAFQAHAHDSVFKIGVSLPLTGAFAEYGAAVKNGIELAQRDEPQKFKELRFLFEDDQYQPKNTVTALNKFVDADQIDLFLVWGNEPALAAAPVSEHRRIPTVVIAQHPKAGVGYHYVLRFINPAADYSSALLKELNQRGLKDLAVIKSEISFFNILLDELAKRQDPGQSLKIIAAFPPTETDFRPIILRLKAAKMDALGVYLTPPQVIQFFRQARELGYKPVSFGATPFESRAVIEGARGLMEGAIYSQLHVEPSFRGHYLQFYSDDFQQAYAGNAYEFAKLAAELFGTNKPGSAEEILSRLESVKPRNGVLGPYRYRTSEQAGKYFEFPVAAKEIVGGEIRELP
jgi:branched-chain amino acid transport system substrate-binding protein